MDIDQTSQTSEDSPQPYQVSNTLWMVPCVIDRKTTTFSPLPLPSFSAASDCPHLKVKWTKHEDRALEGLVQQRGTKAWALVAQTLNQLLHSGQKMRRGKQCRERWLNHLNPELKKGSWTAAEDLLVLVQQREMGNRWSEIAKSLPGRNENSVKNRWKSMLRKAEKSLPPGTDVVEALISAKQKQDSSPLPSLTPLTASSTPSTAFAVRLPSILQIQTQIATSVRTTLMSFEQWPRPHY